MALFQLYDFGPMSGELTVGARASEASVTEVQPMARLGVGFRPEGAKKEGRRDGAAPPPACEPDPSW